MPTYGSLFAGVGGFDMGFDRAGYDCRFQVEWDKNCQNILNRHWPDVPKWWDVSEVNGAELPPVDVLIFGSPCQDLSVAGRRAGLDGARSGLFYEAMRIIKEMRDATANTFPRVVVWENVVGALNSNGGADFGAVLNQMAEAGALVVEWAVLDAQHFGVPQRRRRVFVVAVLDPASAAVCPDPLLPVGESVRGDSAKGRKKGKAASGEAGGGAAVGGERPDLMGCIQATDATKWGSNQWVNEGKAIVQPYVKSRRAQSADDAETWVPGMVAPTLNQFDTGDTRTTTAIVQPADEQFVLFQMHQSGETRIQGEVSHTLAGYMGTGGNNTPMVAQQVEPIGIQGNMIGRADHNGPAGRGYTADGDPMFTLTSTDIHAVSQPTVLQYDGYNQRAYEDDVSVTVRIGRDSSDCIMPDAMIVRRLTPVECERLMGWPDDHTRWTADGKEQADTHRYRQCGNGVATPVAQWIAGHLLPVLATPTTTPTTTTTTTDR